MKIKDIIKKQTMVIALAVILVTVSLIGVSYALFFQVNKNSTDQVITAGTLKVTISGSTLNQTEPMSESEGLSSDPFSYTVVNTDSNLPASYTLCIAEGSSNTINLGLIKISIDGYTVEGLTSKNASEVDDGVTCYEIGTGRVEANGSSETKYVWVWIDENSVNDEIDDKTLDLDLYVVGEVDESSGD